MHPMEENAMKIVPFREKDLDTVVEIQRAAYKPLYDKYRDDLTNPWLETRETVLRKYTAPDTRGYLFLVDDVAVGAVRIRLHPEEKRAKVSALAVLPEYQGRGIAQWALKEIERIHSDIPNWFLDTILEEPGNCHLYEKLGYRRIPGTRKINEKMTLVFYEKP